MSPGSFSSDHQMGDEHQIPYADPCRRCKMGTWSWEFERMFEWAHSK